MKTEILEEHWHKTPLGKALLKAEIGVLSNVLPNIFGYYIVQANGQVDNGDDILSSSTIHNRIVINRSVSPVNNNTLAIQCKLDELPFLPESIDAVVLYHALEFSKKPLTVLKEIYSSLINSGYLLILGFNPCSIWGIIKILKQKRNIPWNGNWISPGKLRRWLVNTGFYVGDYQTCYFRPPNKNPDEMLFMEGIGEILWPYCGASYMFVVHKKAVTLATISNLKSLVNNQPIVKGLPKPTSRVTRCNHNQQL